MNQYLAILAVCFFASVTMAAGTKGTLSFPNGKKVNFRMGAQPRVPASKKTDASSKSLPATEKAKF